MSTKRIAENNAASVRGIARRIRERRELLGLKRERLADLIGVSYTGYSAKEIGTREFGATELVIVARALGVTTDYLLGHEEMEDLDQEDRDTIRFIHNMPPDLQASARAAVRAMHDANARLETTHGKKAE